MNTKPDFDDVANAALAKDRGDKAPLSPEEILAYHHRALDQEAAERFRERLVDDEDAQDFLLALAEAEQEPMDAAELDAAWQDFGQRSGLISQPHVSHPADSQVDTRPQGFLGRLAAWLWSPKMGYGLAGVMAAALLFVWQNPGVVVPPGSNPPGQSASTEHLTLIQMNVDEKSRSTRSTTSEIAGSIALDLGIPYELRHFSGFKVELVHRDGTAVNMFELQPKDNRISCLIAASDLANAREIVIYGILEDQLSKLNQIPVDP